MPLGLDIQSRKTIIRPKPFRAPFKMVDLNDIGG